MQKRVRQFHETLEKYIDTSNEYMDDRSYTDFIVDDVPLHVGYEFTEGDYIGFEDTPDVEEMINTEDARSKSDSYDKNMGVDVVLSYSGDTKLMTKVKKRIIRDDRNRSDYYKPTHNYSVYEIQFPDGSTDEVEANLITGSMVSDCDSEGRHNKLLRGIAEHKKDGTALNVADGPYVSRAGNRTPKKTTKGWKFLVEWVDGSMDSMNLADMKNAYPL